jgi:hypothetical protein
MDNDHGLAPATGIIVGLALSALLWWLILSPWL